jgi:hypothetical protein
MKKQVRIEIITIYFSKYILVFFDKLKYRPYFVIYSIKQILTLNSSHHITIVYVQKMKV